MQLSELNACEPAAAGRRLLQCCGSTRWAQLMTGARPFADLKTMIARGEAIWDSLDAGDWLEAFAAHPQIGAGADSRGWSGREQAGMADAGDGTRRRLAEANAAYASRFGYIFIICATGRTAGEMLEALEQRMQNDPGSELGVAAGEQRRIIALRLAKLVTTEQVTTP
ncbi:MAG TPA: 2-oxo-4-hydroxy-4-carboxy-5-ureidoimidazoline decarboxylase [Vicinamibacterales bacterium]